MDEPNERGAAKDPPIEGARAQRARRGRRGPSESTRPARTPQFEAMLADDSAAQKQIRGKMIRGALFVLMFLAAAFYQVLTSK
jgi:hypothetical protein